MRKFIILVLACSFLSVFYSCKEQKEEKSEYKIDLEYSAQELKGDMQVEFSMPSKLDEICFNLYFNAYKKDATYFAVESQYLSKTPIYGCGEILSVSSYANSLDYFIEQDGGLLRVKLGRTYNKGDRVTLFIKFLVKLSNFNHRLSFGEQTVNLGNFFPILCVYQNGKYVHCPYYNYGDPFYSEVADFEVKFSCGGEYVVASTGNCEDLEVKEKASYLFKAENVRDFFLTLSKDFKVAKQTLNQTEIFYYYLTTEEKELDLISQCLGFFSERFYPYPYSTFSIAQSDFCYGGMEYPQIVLVNKNLTQAELLWTIVHETAHQWWYGIVGNNQIEDAFFDEGLAEYSTILFFENFPSYGISARQDLLNKKIQYLKFSDFFTAIYGKNYNFAPYRKLNEYKNSTDYINSVYLYTPYAFWQIGSAIGQEDFCIRLNNFAKKYAYKAVNNQTFVDFMEVNLKSVLNGKFPV